MKIMVQALYSQACMHGLKQNQFNHGEIEQGATHVGLPFFINLPVRMNACRGPVILDPNLFD